MRALEADDEVSCSRHLLAVERPYSDPLSASILAAEIPGAGHSNYAKYRSQGTDSPILDALLSPTLEALRLRLPTPPCLIQSQWLTCVSQSTD
jgi:hypothetical protein